MRKKRLLIMIAIMLLVVFLLSFTLMACKKTKPEDTPGGGNETPSGTPGGGTKPPIIIPPDDEPEIPNYASSFENIMNYVVEAMPSNYLSMNFSGSITVRDKKYVMSVKGNLAEDDVQVSAVFKPEGSNNLAFAMYIVDSKLFFEFEDGTVYNIAEIDVNYLISIVDKLPDKLSGIIKDLLGQQISSILPSVLGLLLDGFAPSNEIVYTEVDGVETFEMGIDLQGMFSLVQGLLQPGGLLSMFLPANIDLTFLYDLLNMIPLINGTIKSTVDNGTLTEFGVELFDNDPESENYQQTLVGFDSAITFSSTALELEIPEYISKNYEALTLGNLNADFSLDIDTNGEPFDIGAIIDAFMPKALFGEGVLVLDGNAEYSLDVKVSLDPNLDGLKVDNNYVNAVLKSGENELVRVNYLEGYLYVKALANGVNGFGDGGLNVAIPLDLSEYISKLVKLVTDAIDGFLGTQFKPSEPTTALTLLSASINESGETILTPSIQSVILGVLKLVGFDEAVDMTGNSIVVNIDKDLINKILELAKLNPIDWPIFGDLTLGLFGGGIEYVEIAAFDVLTLRADNFLIGKAKISKQDIEDSIGDKDVYGEDVESIVLSFALALLNDLELSLDLDLSTINTTVNLTPLVNNIMAMADNRTYLNMPITLDLSKYDGTFKLRVATSYDEATNDGRILFELITPDGDTLISAYNENSNTYVDLTQLGFMKFCLSHVNIFQMIRGLLGAETFSEDVIEEVVPTMALAAQTSGVEIGNDHLGVAVDSYFVTLLMRILGMDLGMDASLKAYLNFDGSVNATLGLGDAAEIGIKLSLGKESQCENRIKDIIKSLEKLEYGVYNAIDAEMLVDSILVAEQLNLTLDLYNNNIDYPSHDNKTRIMIRNSTAKAPGQLETFGNGLQAPYKSMVFGLFDGWTNDESQALLWGYLDFDGKKVQIKGTAKTFSVGVTIFGKFIGADGTMINVPIENVDLKGMLVNALSGIFTKGEDVEENEDYGGAIDVPEGALPPQKPQPDDPTEPADPSESEETPSIDQLLKGIKLTLSGNMDISANVNIDGVYISNMLKNLLTDVFTDMDLESMTGDASPVTINYNNETKDTFFNDLYSKLILPLIKQQIGGLGGTIVEQIAKLDALKSQVHALVQRFLPLPDVQDFEVDVSITDGKLADITLIGSNEGGFDAQGFGIYIFNRKTAIDRVVNWQNQETNIYFNPNLGFNLMDMFEPQARKHVADSNEASNWETDSWQTISWTLKDSGVDLATFNANLSDYEDGEYIFVGRAWDSEIEVKVTLHTAEIDHINDIQVKAMRDIPTYVTVVFADGSEQLITGVDIACDSRVNGENNASVTFGETTYEFTIEFEGEALSLDTLVLNAYDYLDVMNELEASGIAKVKVNDSFYRNLPATYDFSEIKAIPRTQLQKPNTYEVKVQVGKDTDYECELPLKVEFTPFDIYSIERNGVNYIETDFIEYSKGESFPDEITVVGYNGKEILKYTAKVSEWNTTGVTIDLKGGQYFASAVINKGEYNEWKLEGIEVDVLSTDIVELADSSKSVVFDWKYYFYGNVEIEKVLPSLLNFKASDGTIKKDVPVTIDISSIFQDLTVLERAMQEGMTFECPVTVDVENNGKPLLETTVTVVVPSVKMSLIETEITVDYEEYMTYGSSLYFKDSIEIMLGDDEVTARVTWFTDAVVFNKNGSYKARVYINQNGDYEQWCEVTVNVTNAPTTQEV